MRKYNIINTLCYMYSIGSDGLKPELGKFYFEKRIRNSV